MTKLAKDGNNSPIQVLGYKLGGAQKVIANSASAVVSSAISQHTKVVTVFCDQSIYFELSNSSSVTANTNSHYMLSASYQTIKVRDQGNTDNMYFAFQNVSSNATIYISERI